MLRIERTPSRFWSVHTHSKYSFNDALPSVETMVERAKKLRYRALGLTDHGNMAGSVQLYKQCVKAGIKPFPGSEFYLVQNRNDKKSKRYHVGMVAFSTMGYRNLVQISTRSHRQFHHKPLLDLADLAELHEVGMTQGVALTTGCHFGLVNQTLETDGPEAAKRIIAAYETWFPGATYIEIQNHNITHDDGSTDDDAADALVDLADQMGLPVVITQDSHYAEESDRSHHETLKRLVAYGPDVDDAVFPGDGFHMADDAWISARHSGSRLARGLAGLDHLYDRHTLVIPELEEYDYRVPTTVAEPAKALRQRCTKELYAKGLAKNRYFDRLEAELEVVDISRMAGYLMLVAEVTDYCRSVDIFYQARGSASGSLICWLLGITSVDPLKWGLLMERFLSKDRMKPPDVDLDVEHDRRGELIDWLSSRYSVCQIGTFSTYSLSGDDEDGKGSLRVRYLSSLRKRGQDPTWANLPAEAKAELYSLSDLELHSGYGTHAAGLVVTTTRQEMETLVPLMYVASSKTFVSQYDMGDIESLGLVKLDVLGLKTLSVLRKAILNLGREAKDGLDFIPLTDSKTFKSISHGETAGVFQLEGGTARRGMYQLRPSHVRDIIASMALYRPATMSSGATDAYIERKHGRARTPQRHELIEKHTKETHGILLYQEQVMAVLRDLGMAPDNLTRFLKAVKASNGNIGDARGEIEEMLVEVSDLAQASGMGRADLEWLKEALEAYAGYGFNKAHSVVYGLTAYRCAYLATNHPLEFHAALLEVAAGTTKEDEYVRATRARGVRVLKADVNTSKASYAIDPRRKGIRRGLVSIKGVGIKASEAIASQQPFRDIPDFLSRVNPRAVTGIKTATPDDFQNQDLSGTLAKLRDAGALDSLMEA